jgi:hypothetical protein
MFAPFRRERATGTLNQPVEGLFITAPRHARPERGQLETVAQLAHQMNSQSGVETVEALLTLAVQVCVVARANLAETAKLRE